MACKPSLSTQPYVEETKVLFVGQEDNCQSFKDISNVLFIRMLMAFICFHVNACFSSFLPAISDYSECAVSILFLNYRKFVGISCYKWSSCDLESQQTSQVKARCTSLIKCYLKRVLLSLQPFSLCVQFKHNR